MHKQTNIEIETRNKLIDAKDANTVGIVLSQITRF